MGTQLAQTAPLGLIAGAGTLPKLVAAGARAAGRRLVVVGLHGWADPDLQNTADAFSWRGVVRLGGWIRDFRRHGVNDVIMVGRVAKADMFAMPRWKQLLMYLPDWTSFKVWYFGTRDKRNDTLLCAVADELQHNGITMIDSTTYCKESLAPEGPLTPGQPPKQVTDDAEFAWPILRQIAGLDIGQALAVKEREIIAVEAIEGTDGLIKRTADLCPAGGWTLVKIAKPNQDMRFDVPTIGPNTIESLHASKAKGLVIEADKTIILEREKTVTLAKKYGIAIIGHKAE